MLRTSCWTALCAVLAISTSVNADHMRGIPWGCDNRIAEKPFGQLMSWYHHWADGRVPQLDKQGFQYVPTLWGPSKLSDWHSRKSELNDMSPDSSYILSFNEPDIPGQANLSPQAAVDLHMKELQPYANKGFHVSTPQVNWKLDWLKQFKQGCDKRGCKIDFLAIHWYGKTTDFDKLTKWISDAHSVYPDKCLWITEYGITAESGASQSQIKDFHMRALEYFSQHDFICRSAWLGGFPKDNPPDAYPSPLNAYFNGDGSHTELLTMASNAKVGSTVSRLGGSTMKPTKKPSKDGGDVSSSSSSDSGSNPGSAPPKDTSSNPGSAPPKEAWTNPGSAPPKEASSGSGQSKKHKKHGSSHAKSHKKHKGKKCATKN